MLQKGPVEKKRVYLGVNTKNSEDFQLLKNCLSRNFTTYKTVDVIRVFSVLSIDTCE